MERFRGFSKLARTEFGRLLAYKNIDLSGNRTNHLYRHRVLRGPLITGAIG